MRKFDNATLNMDFHAETAFRDNMDPGVILSNRLTLPSGATVAYPDYLEVDEVRTLSLEDRVDPAALPTQCALIYGDNAYITDDRGNIAYIHCRMRHVDGASGIRRKHSEYRTVGGRKAAHLGMDAGHFGLSLGQHPSLAMEQDSIMNRYGVWRELERDWDRLSRDGHEVIVRGVFADSDGGTYSPYWCIEEIIDDGNSFEYILTNDASQS